MPGLLKGIEMKEIKIDVGCGSVPQKGYNVYLDKYDHGNNIVFDLESGKKMPFKTNSVSNIWCRNVLEHLSNIEFVMDEFHRILKKGGILEIVVPFYRHPNSVNPLHKRYFGWQSMNYWSNQNSEMRLRSMNGFGLVEKKWIFEDKNLEFLFGWYASRKPLQYEKWLGVFFPARKIYLKLKKR